MTQYIVKQGDCIESIAFEHGLLWETVWNDPNNADLRSLRENPNALLPGDRVFVPSKRIRQEKAFTEARHRFRRKGVPCSFLVQVMSGDKVRAKEPYTLTVEGKVYKGQTDAQGLVRISIPPSAAFATLVVGGPENSETYELNLGGMDPVSELTGVQARLENLGYSCGDEGELDAETRGAIQDFQVAQGLELSGEPDEATRKRLLEVHGS